MAAGALDRVTWTGSSSSLRIYTAWGWCFGVTAWLLSGENPVATLKMTTVSENPLCSGSAFGNPLWIHHFFDTRSSKQLLTAPTASWWSSSLCLGSQTFPLIQQNEGVVILGILVIVSDYISWCEVVVTSNLCLDSNTSSAQSWNQQSVWKHKYRTGEVPIYCIWARHGFFAREKSWLVRDLLSSYFSENFRNSLIILKSTNL